MARQTHHVVHNSQGGWDVKRGGAQRASGHYATKEAAVKAGRTISRNQGTEFLIHGKMGVFSPLIVMGETRSRRKGNTDKKGVACGLRPSFNVAIQSGFKSN